MPRATDKEVWEKAPEPFAKYEISSFGEVRNGGRLLSGCVDRYGYRSVLLSAGGSQKRFKVHRLVCAAFHGPPFAGAHAAHLDGNSLNNAASNLMWASAKDNNAHKLVHGTSQVGERHPRSRLTAAQIADIRSSSLSTRALAAAYGVSQPHISRIRTQKRWV